VDAPILANLYSGWDTAAMIFGVERITDNQGEMYRAAVEKIKSFVDQDEIWEKIKPIEVTKEKAPCKEVLLVGELVAKNHSLFTRLS
jgi:ubiquinone/menaquinone biosynthesis C-methylase UbiE